jgi:hypothetical protein
MDRPFTENLDACLRFYQKSWPYPAAVGSTNSANSVHTTALPSQNIHCGVPFKKIMARTPTGFQSYSPTTGLAGAVRDVSAGTDRGIGTFFDLGDSGFGGVTIPSPNSAQAIYQFHYFVDTGW